MGKHSPHTALVRELSSLAKRAGGSHATIDARQSCATTFAEHLQARGYTISSVQQIKMRHITSYLNARRDAGHSARTIQNVATHLRTMLVTRGREQFVREQLSSAALGLEKTSRDGTKVAMSDRQYQDFVALAMARDRGVAAGLMLARELGLRGQEAVMSCRSLDAWRASLEGHSPQPITVSAGTKGGRVRTLPVQLLPSRERALDAVKLAQQVAAERGGVLIDRPTLAQAVDRWDNECRGIGLAGETTAHSLRYAFAVAAIEAFKAHGHSERQALALTSCLLGHGEGRGRWVRQVYSRTAPEDTSVACEGAG